MAPAASPPTEKPCATRSMTSRMGAAMPMAAYVGSRPMPAVATLISAMTNDQHALAPDPVAEDAADDRAERPDEERDGVTGEHERMALLGLVDAEEDDGQRAGHEGEDAVVVQLDEDADAARGHDLGDVRAFGDRCVGNVRGGRVGRGHADS